MRLVLDRKVFSDDEGHRSTKFTFSRPIAFIVARRNVAANVPRFSFPVIEGMMTVEPLPGLLGEPSA
jgi:hypothetical protein